MKSYYVKKQKVHKSKYEVPSTGYSAHITSPVYENPNILEYSRHTLNFSGNYCDSCNQLLSIFNKVVINRCLHTTTEIKIKK